MVVVGGEGVGLKYSEQNTEAKTSQFSTLNQGRFRCIWLGICSVFFADVS